MPTNKLRHITNAPQRELGVVGAQVEQVLNEWVANIDLIQTIQTCASCLHMSTDRKTCKKFNAVPPCDVVVQGCDDYSDNLDIPF